MLSSWIDVVLALAVAALMLRVTALESRLSPSAREAGTQGSEADTVSDGESCVHGYLCGCPHCGKT